MATGDCTLVKLTEHIPIPEADKIVEVRILGETVVVGKDTPEGTLGLLFDMETKLSSEFLKNNNLYRHENLNIDQTKKGYFEDNGRVRPIRLKGVRVTSFWIPIESLSYIKNLPPLKEGDSFSKLGTHEICSKYLPPNRGGNITPKQKKKGPICSMFKEHFDTDQLLRNLRDVPIGPFVITVKLHGTSGRVIHGKLDSSPKWYEKLFGLFRPSAWKNIVGSRTVVKSVEGENANLGGNFYDLDIWTQSAEKYFKGKLLKGECIYYEIVGHVGDKPIQPAGSAESLKTLLNTEEYKKIVDEFGTKLHYTYGCVPNQYDVYVYRITHTTIDGDSIDLSWEQVKKRCEKLGVPHVPEFTTGRKYDANTYLIHDGDYRAAAYSVRDFADIMEDMARTAIHNRNFPEGVCLRVEGYPNCKIWKHKNLYFKCVEQGLKTLEAPDIEEEA